MNNRNYRHQEDHQGARSRHRRPPPPPPPHHGNWQPTVPSWEKRFCYSVGSVPWRKLLETKKSMYLYDNVVQWNDSAGEEAFHNAKDRFWAKINGLPCNISLPDPDIYIDEIDWNSDADPELLLDLEREVIVPNGEEVVILGSSFMNHSFSCTGWGDAEQDPQKAVDTRLDHVHGDDSWNVINGEMPWESNVVNANGVSKDEGWGNCWNNMQGWENNNSGWDDDNHGWKNVGQKDHGGWGTWDNDNGNRGGSGYYTSRYKTSRFHGDDHQVDRGWWRNGRGRKRANFAY